MIFSTNKQNFLSRSGYLWVQPSKYLASTYFASNLAHPQGLFYFYFYLFL